MSKSRPDHASTIVLVAATHFEERTARRATLKLAAEVPLGVERCGIACGQTSAAQMTSGVGALMSVGFAAGLAADAPSGSVVLPETIASNSGDPIAVHAGWRASIGDALTGLAANATTLLQVEEVLTTEAAKAAASDGGRFAAADMESYTLAAWCQEAEIPFTALRIVLDDFESEVPRALAEDGDEAGVRAVWRAFRSDPLALVRFLRTVRSANKAMFNTLHRLTPAQLDIAPLNDRRAPS